jgi:dihydroorotase
VDPFQDLDQILDVIIEDGKVAAVGEGLETPSDTEVFDAGGLIVAPGFIDLAAHLREPGFEHKETIASGSRAAVAGGFTAVCCTADTDPVNDDPAVTTLILERAGEVRLAHIYPIGAVTRGMAGDELAEIGEMARGGAVAVGDSDRTVADAMLMRRALEYARSFELPVVAHCENPDLVEKGLINEGPVSTRLGMRGIPAIAEEVAIARDLAMARFTNGRLHIRHVSTAAGLDLIRSARAEGVAVTCDVSPQYFCLTDEALTTCTYHPNWKTRPPLRSFEDGEAVKRALADGTIDAITSDHQPHHTDDKERDFSEAPAGIVGLETAVSLSLDRLVHGGVVDVAGLVRLMSTGPAAAFGLPGGTLCDGSPADVTILDLERTVTVDPSSFESKSRNTPFAGWELRGAPVATIVAGRKVWTATG